jgi:hypothetical protein
MTINTKGNDTITMASCLQALDNIITSMPADNLKPVVEPEVVEEKKGEKGYGKIIPSIFRRNIASFLYRC